MTHFSHAAFIHQVNDQLHLMHAFEVCAFRLIACFYQGFKACVHQSANAAAENCLLTKEVGFGFFAEGGFQSACTGTANALSISQSQVMSLAGRVLVSSYQNGNTAAFGIGTTNQMAGAFRSNHEYVYISRRNNLTEVNVEAVCKSQCITSLQVRSDIFFICSSLLFIRNQHHDDIGSLSSFCGSHNLQAGSFCLSFGLRAFIQAYNYVYAALLQVQCMCMALRTITDNSNCFAIQ